MHCVPHGYISSTYFVKMLADFHRSIIAEFSGTGDGLLILGRGLGGRQILSTMISVHADSKNLVLLLNTPVKEVQSLQQSLVSHAFNHHPESSSTKIHPDLLKVITASINAKERANVYLSGGVLCVTSTILVVDILNGIVPMDLISGVIVNHAHRVTDISPETFILRLIRDKNKTAFIRAISEQPESFVHGMWKLEKSMKLLFQRQVYLWPRFHMDVIAEYDAKSKPNLHEFHIPLTRNMRDIQSGLIECLQTSLNEVKRAMRDIDIEEFTVENSFFQAFDVMVRMQLDRIWHRVTPRTKDVVQDLRVLRLLLTYLVTYDAATFYSFLETILAENAASSQSIRDARGASWLLLDAAHLVFEAARKRVYVKKPSNAPVDVDVMREFGVPDTIEPVMEELPKWRVLYQILHEIEAKRKDDVAKGRQPGRVLIMVESDRSRRQVHDLLRDFKFGETQAPTSHPLKFSGPGVEKLSKKLCKNYFRVKNQLASMSRSIQRTTSSSNVSAQSTAARGRGSNAVPPNKRRRVRGASASAAGPSRPHSNESNAVTTLSGLPWTLEDGIGRISRVLNDGEGESSDMTDRRRPPNTNETVDVDLVTAGAPTDELDQNPEEDVFDNEDIILVDPSQFHMLDPSASVIIRTYAVSSNQSQGHPDSNGEDDLDTLLDLQPDHVVMYDADVGFVRRLELYQSAHRSSSQPPVDVYFMVYSESVEEQKYLSMIRKEKEAFEKLIRAKSILAAPIDQDGRSLLDEDTLFYENVDTRLAGGQLIPASERGQVIVDVREFRSTLPLLLHSHRMKLKPCTLEVGDYVLTPDVCVERKALPDLVQSLKSGRLYTQATAMCAHYVQPVLLIEFEQGKRYSILNNVSDDISLHDLQSKLVLLVLAFPKLKVIWSPSPDFTSKIFVALKKDQLEPKMEEAMAIGVENISTLNSEFHPMAADVLRSLPGITSRNYRHVMSKVKNLGELFEMDVDGLKRVVGEENARNLHAFLHKNVSGVS